MNLQELPHQILALLIKKALATVLAAVYDFEFKRSAKLFVFASQFMRLVDRHLRILIAVDDEQWWIGGIHVLDWTGEFGQLRRIFRLRP